MYCLSENGKKTAKSGENFFSSKIGFTMCMWGTGHEKGNDGLYLNKDNLVLIE